MLKENILKFGLVEGIKRTRDGERILIPASSADLSDESSDSGESCDDFAEECLHPMLGDTGIKFKCAALSLIQ